MDFSEYQELVGQTDEKQRMHISAYGLVDETGSVINVLKKRLLAGEKYPGYLESLREELGDLMWYIASVATYPASSYKTLPNEMRKRRAHFTILELTKTSMKDFRKISAFRAR